MHLKNLLDNVSCCIPFQADAGDLDLRESLHAGTQTHWKCRLTGSEFKHRRKRDVNGIRHFRTLRQKKLFSLARCFLPFFPISVPDLLSNDITWRETGLKYSSQILFFPASGDLLVPLLRPARAVCSGSRCSNWSRRGKFPLGIHLHSFCSFCLTLTV